MLEVGRCLSFPGNEEHPNLWGSLNAFVCFVITIDHMIHTDHQVHAPPGGLRVVQIEGRNTRIRSHVEIRDREILFLAPTLTWVDWSIFRNRTQRAREPESERRRCRSAYLSYTPMYTVSARQAGLHDCVLFPQNFLCLQKFRIRQTAERLTQAVHANRFP